PITGPASFAPQQTFVTGISPSSVALGDVNGDGRPDLITANANAAGGTVSVLLNTTGPRATSPAFAPQQTCATRRGPFPVALGDVNGDGRPDLLVANLNDDNVGVLLNTTAPGATSPAFAPQQTFATGSVPYSVALGD